MNNLAKKNNTTIISTKNWKRREGTLTNDTDAIYVDRFVSILGPWPLNRPLWLCLPSILSNLHRSTLQCRSALFILTASHVYNIAALHDSLSTILSERHNAQGQRYNTIAIHPPEFLLHGTCLRALQCHFSSFFGLFFLLIIQMAPESS